ncbi:MAG TPA: formate dehydrogenase subunit gamma [Steroidobacteraceae bacterium]|nr:formate dehydrogenase subunit gamma [Steroidobacteraceae bacterium]
MSKRQRVSIPIRPEPGSDLPAAQRDAVLDAVRLHREAPGPLLPILHAIQQRLGFIAARLVPLIAHELNLSRAEVHGVISFYHYFRQYAPGRHVIYVCRAEACQSVGARELESHAKRSLGIDFHGTSADGRYSLEAVYCLGNCACGPSMLIDRELHSHVTPDRFDAITRRGGP